VKRRPTKRQRAIWRAITREAGHADYDAAMRAPNPALVAIARALPRAAYPHARR